MQETTDIAMSAEEHRRGFSVQTLTYPPDDYELSGLRAEGRSLLERTVALTLDEGSRLRRRRHGSGYVLERCAGEVWRVAGEFASLDEVDAAGLSQRAPDAAEERAADSE